MDINPELRPNIFILRRNSGSGGAEKAAERLASQLASSYPVLRMWAGQSFLQQSIPGQSGPPWWRSLRYSRFIDRLKLKQDSTNILLSLEYGPDCHIYRAGDGVHKLNVKRRYGNHPGWMVNPWHWYAPMQERKGIRSAEVVVANSNLVKGLLEQTYPQWRDKFITIYNGYDPDIYYPDPDSKISLRQQYQLPELAPVLLLSGHGFGRKGVKHLINLLARLRLRSGFENALAVIIGDGDKSAFAAQLKHTGLTDAVNFVGRVAAPADFYRLADFMVLPTRHDPFSNACLEALACGCPVLTSHDNGAAEILMKTTGYTFTGQYDVKDLEQAANFITEFATPCVEVARSVSHLTAEAEIASYLQVIDNILSSERDTA